MHTYYTMYILIVTYHSIISILIKATCNKLCGLLKNFNEYSVNVLINVSKYLNKYVISTHVLYIYARYHNYVHI